MAYEISRDEILEMIESGESFEFLEVNEDGSEKPSRQDHLPTAIQVPFGPDFEDRVEEQIPDRNMEVIVYSGGADPEAATRAAARMENMGYGNVFVYRGGKSDWRKGDLPLVRSHDEEAPDGKRGQRPGKPGDLAA